MSAYSYHGINLGSQSFSAAHSSNPLFLPPRLALKKLPLKFFTPGSGSTPAAFIINSSILVIIHFSLKRFHYIRSLQVVVHSCAVSEIDDSDFGSP